MSSKRQFVVWGLGRFGSSVALTLAGLGYEVLGIDNNEEVVQELSESLTHVVLSDSMDEGTVKALGLRNFDVGVVGMGDLEASLMCTMLLKEAGINTIVAKASSQLHGKMLEKIGANMIIYPERDMGKRVGHNLAYSNIFDNIELNDDLSLMEINVGSSIVGKSLVEIDVRKKFGVNVVGIKHKDGSIEINMDPNEPLGAEDVLVVVGAKESVLKLESGL